MITFNKQQQEVIANLNPLSDSKIKYNASKWANLNADFKSLITEFENKEITRQNIINAYKHYYSNNNIDIMKVLLLTMVWGYADIGFGTYRTNKYMNNSDKISKIAVALNFIQENEQNSLKNAFDKLKEIKGLGVSYITKILYFSTRASNVVNYVLIFDIRVAAALVKLTTPREIHEIVKISPSSNFENYQKFNNLIHKLAKDSQVEADQMEMYLFNQDLD